MGHLPRHAPGPFRASQIREGDPYELSDGHAIRCMTAGGRHARAHSAGDRVLATDPAVRGEVGVDVGITWGEERNLRAPDLAVGKVEPIPGWQRTFPPLAVEYADSGQDEAELQQKIAELLAGGTRLVWVVRLAGPLRVEVYAPGQAVQLYRADDALTAPGILKNPVPVRALVDGAAADAATLRNLLQTYGYESVEEIETRKLAEGLSEGLARGLEATLAARGLVPDEQQRAVIRACRDPAVLGRWLERATTATSVAAVLD
ncbi:MAG TPA: Uma2 family endonuclease [Nannocystis sp.]